MYTLIVNYIESLKKRNNFLKSNRYNFDIFKNYIETLKDLSCYCYLGVFLKSQ